MLKIPVSQHENPRVVRTHCVVGYRMLSSISVWHDIAPMVLYHHEWWNGEGYPEGLSKTDIPFESRIIAVADAFDSMTNGGSYRDPISAAEAVGRIDDCSGTQFDPDVARAINALLSRGDLDQ
jgi:HD-GYP domain-containing protein (c-di-GMP phosphodiesterase class II)